MHGKVEQQTFDAVERELVRKKLIGYMKENGIGAPKLAERIKASHPREIEIPLSTLQRFLAGRGKNEFCVAQCHRFAERLTISDSIAKLGERLSIFYGAGNGHDYSGNYRTWRRFRNCTPRTGKRSWAMPARTFRIRFGVRKCISTKFYGIVEE